MSAALGNNSPAPRGPSRIKDRVQGLCTALLAGENGPLLDGGLPLRKQKFQDFFDEDLPRKGPYKSLRSLMLTASIEFT